MTLWLDCHEPNALPNTPAPHPVMPKFEVRQL